MKKVLKVDKQSQKTPVIGTKITFHLPRGSKLRSSRSDLLDLISLNQSILEVCSQGEKID